MEFAIVVAMFGVLMTIGNNGVAKDARSCW